MYLPVRMTLSAREQPAKSTTALRSSYRCIGMRLNGASVIGMISPNPSWQILPDRNTVLSCIQSLNHQRVQTQLFNTEVP